MPLEAPPFRFTALAKIASGGTATVYVGDRAGQTTLVALKRPHAHVLEDERQRAALLREARLASTLRHPNIVVVELVEEAGDELQLVMDYVEGSALGTLIVQAAKRDMRLPPGIAVRIVLDACRGLHAVHEHRGENGVVLGLVHRDVSPQNILVGVDGVAKLTDFGLAKAMYEGAPSTTQGTLKGKLGYMAPEYVNRGELDRTIDVFAMGVVLWEALAGRRLFRGDNEAQTLDRILHAEASPLSEIAPELAPFDALVAWALAKDPSDRLCSAEALASLLETTGMEAHALATRDEVATYVREVAGTELTRRHEEVRQERRRRGRMRAPPWVWGVVGTAMVSTGAWLLVRAVHGPPPPSPALRADTAVATSDSSTHVQSAPSASAAESDETVTIELDPAQRSTQGTVRARGVAPRQVPPNPYVHHDAGRAH